jgi:hypothetical protein
MWAARSVHISHADPEAKRAVTLRRCPFCKNTVARESRQCPICGYTHVGAIVRKLIPWTVLFLLLVFWIGRRWLER